MEALLGEIRLESFFFLLLQKAVHGEIRFEDFSAISGLRGSSSLKCEEIQFCGEASVCSTCCFIKTEFPCKDGRTK